MGGERASTTRRREAGKICCSCSAPLPPPIPGTTPTYKPGWRTGERYCNRCGDAARPHIVSMRFEALFDTWRVSLTAKGHGSLGLYTLADTARLEAMATRGGAFRNLADKQGFEAGVRARLGTIELHLTDEQWQKLKK